MSTPEEHLDILVRAVYPIVYIVSHEEKRVEKALRKVAQGRDKQFYTWSCARGVEGEAAQDNDQLKDPIEALEFVRGNQHPAMFVFMDLHPYVNDPTVKRTLRELADSLKTMSTTLVLLSSVLELPSELEKQVTVVDWPLPGKEEIGNLFDGVVEKIGQRGLDLTFTADERDKIVTSCLGMTGDEIDNVLAKSLVRHKNIALEEIIAEKEQVIRKSGILEFYPTDESIQTVGGMANLKNWLMTRGGAFSERAKAYGLTPPKGVILIGIQGCGKSLVCKALASLWLMPLLRFDVGKIFEGIVGSTEKNIRRAIQTAEAIAPCVLWIDEMEKGFSGTKSSQFTDGGVTARAFSAFLTWQQEKKFPVFTIATCNRIADMPPEMLRKGRFDEIFFVDFPNKDERIDIFGIHLKKRERNPEDFDLVELSEACPNFSGAEIEAAIEEGMGNAFYTDENVATAHILTAILETVPLAETAKEEIEMLRTWAENRARPASIQVEEPQALVSGSREIDFE